MRKPTDILVVFAIALTCIGLAVFTAFLWVLSKSFSISSADNLNIAATGVTGDFLSGVVGTIWSLAGILLFYSALRLQRREFDLQRRELADQRREFVINRVTSTIYKQLEIIDESAKKLRLDLRPGKLSEGEEVISTVVTQRPLRGENVNKFKTFCTERSTLIHLRTVLKSLELCIDLIDAKHPKDEWRVGEMTLILENSARFMLFKVLAANLDAYNLRTYFEQLKEVHEEIWESDGKPGLGRFHLNQIERAMQLVVQIEHPGTGIPLKALPAA